MNEKSASEASARPGEEKKTLESNLSTKISVHQWIQPDSLCKASREKRRSRRCSGVLENMSASKEEQLI